MKKIYRFFSRAFGKFNLEFMRFALVGSCAALIHYVIFLLILYFLKKEWSSSGSIDWQTNLAYSIGYILSLVFNLFLTSIFTFKAKITISRFCLFMVSHGLNYLIHKILLNLYLLFGVANWLLLPLVLIITVPINFIMVRVSFKHH